MKNLILPILATKGLKLCSNTYHMACNNTKMISAAIKSFKKREELLQKFVIFGLFYDKLPTSYGFRARTILEDLSF